MDREKFNHNVVQALGSSVLLWLLVMLWEKIPSYGALWGIASIFITMFIVAAVLVIIVGFSSVQYESTRTFLSFVFGLLGTYLTSMFFNWRWDHWYEFLFAILTLILASRLFSGLLEFKKFQRCLEALLITILSINMLRFITFL